MESEITSDILGNVHAELKLLEGVTVTIKASGSTPMSWFHVVGIAARVYEYAQDELEHLREQVEPDEQAEPDAALARFTIDEINRRTKEMGHPPQQAEPAAES